MITPLEDVNICTGIHERLEMKKIILVLNSVILFADTSGMSHDYLADRRNVIGPSNLKRINKNDREPECCVPVQQQNTRVLSSSNSRQRFQPQHQKKLHPHGKSKAHDFDLLTQKKLDPDTEEKINNFANKLKSRTHRPDQIKKALIEYHTQPNVSIDKIAKKNGIAKSTLFSWKKSAGLSVRGQRTKGAITSIQEEIDHETRKKIHNFAQNRQSQMYSAQQIEDALIEWITEGHNKSSKIPYWSLQCWRRESGIFSSYKDSLQKSNMNKQNLINSLNQGAEWKNIHNVFGKNPGYTRQVFGELQEKGLVEIPLNEEEKEDLLRVYRKGLLTRKGIAKKYNIKESDVFCILHEARKQGKDLTQIKISPNKKHSRKDKISKITKEKLIKDYNEALLTIKGLGLKYSISRGSIQRILSKCNTDEIKKRQGKRIKYEKLILDLKNKSEQEIEQKYGYHPSYIDELNRCITYWEGLTDEQKELFKTTMKSCIMPAKDALSAIKLSSNDCINEKFKKLLFVLISTRSETIKKYDLSIISANKLRRHANLWKALAKQE